MQLISEKKFTMSHSQKTASSSSNESLNLLRIGPGTDFYNPSNTMPLSYIQMNLFDINKQSMPFISQTSKIFLSKNTTDNMSNSTAYLPARNLSIQDYLLMNETCNQALNKAKLKQSSNVSALLSGFALVKMEKTIKRQFKFYFYFRLQWLKWT